jgi:hypothetical protein
MLAKHAFSCSLFVRRPQSFQRSLDTMSALSFDFSVVLGGLCIVDMSFYQVRNVATQHFV